MLHFKTGSKLQIELATGEVYEGTFYSGNEHRISLNNVSEQGSSIIQQFLTYFYKVEISSIRRLDNSEDETIENVEETIENLHISNTSTDLIDDYDNWKNLCEDFIYVDVIDPKFYEYIQELKEYETIAVQGLGSSLGRAFKITILAIATKDKIYLFDIKKCDVVFKEGLKELLESKKVYKIVHNSMTFLDCLYKWHNVMLNNFFDTQVADYILATQKEEKIEQMKKLSECATLHLKLPDGLLDKTEFHIQVLLDRPLSQELKQNICLSVAYLLPLKRVLETKLNKILNSTVNYYNNSMRYANPVVARQMNDDEIPEYFKNITF